MTGAGAGGPADTPAGSGNHPEDPDDGPPHCYRHPDRETYISCVRCGRPICPECMRPAAVGFQCPEEIASRGSSGRAPRTVFGGAVRHRGRDATSILIAINVVVFVITTASGTSLLGNHVSELFARFAEIPTRTAYSASGPVFQGIAHGDWYRLVTAMFLHFGLLHIAFNMYVLFLVGPALERALGRFRFVALYLLAGLGGTVSSFLFGSLHEAGAGASGAIFGLFGAYYVVARRVGAETGPIVATIALNLIISVAVPNIDIRAHLGGLVVGAILGAVLAYAPRERRTQIQVAGFVVVLALLAVAAALRGAQIRHDETSQALAPRPAAISAVLPDQIAAPAPPSAAR